MLRVNLNVSLSCDEIAQPHVVATRRIARCWECRLDRRVQRRNGNGTPRRLCHHPTSRQRLRAEAEKQNNEAEARPLERA